MTWVRTICAVALLVVLTLLPASADDREKAQRQINQITAMSADVAGRRIVNLTMAEFLGMRRDVLVQERRHMGLNYGSLLVALTLAARGSNMEHVRARLRAGKSIFQISDELNADWKQIAKDAKKLNGKIGVNLYEHFLHSEGDLARDQADHYDLRLDGVRADSDVSEEEMAEAQNTYVFWHNQAGQILGRDGRLDVVKQNAARMDHLRMGGPQSQDGGAGSTAPEAGGLPNR